MAGTITALGTAATLVVGGAGGARAQLELPPLLPTTTTTAPGAPQPAPEPAPPPPTTTTTEPASLLGQVLKSATTAPPTTAPPPTTAARPTPQALPGNSGGEGEAPPAEAGPFPSHLAAMMNSVKRTRPNNSSTVVDGLKVLTDAGMSPEEAIKVGMGRFPVGGRASFVHDWWFPRFGPGWRLHQGTDIFAERGTPVRSPTTGTVSFSDGGLGGISVYITQGDGTYFYLAHLDRRPADLKPGQTVNTGDIVGYVGSTGNAAGGSAHLHFEVHPAIRFVTVGKGRKATTKAVSAPVRPGTQLPAIDPKPLLDLYLVEALQALPAIADQYRATRSATTPTPASEAVPVGTEAIEVATRHLAVGGLIAAEAPLVRTPLLLLAFLLIVMVLVLFPVLAPGRRLAMAGVPPSPAPPRAGGRRRRARKGASSEEGGPRPAAADSRSPDSGGTHGGGTDSTGSGPPDSGGRAGRLRGRRRSRRGDRREAASRAAGTGPPGAAAVPATPSPAEGTPVAPPVRFSGNLSANAAGGGKAKGAKPEDGPPDPARKDRRPRGRRRRTDSAPEQATVGT